MCGRYLFKQEVDEETRDWLNKLDPTMLQDLSLKEVYPSQKTLVLAEHLEPKIMQWGFQKWDQKGLVINARIETITESEFFKHHLKARRCLVQAEGFYEWDKDKQKHLVSPSLTKTFYMAGIYTDDPLPRFCIITNESTGDFNQLHTRIPLMIPTEYKERYLQDGANLLNDFKQLKQMPIKWENQSPLQQLF